MSIFSFISIKNFEIRDNIAKGKFLSVFPKDILPSIQFSDIRKSKFCLSVHAQNIFTMSSDINYPAQQNGISQ